MDRTGKNESPIRGLLDEQEIAEIEARHPEGMSSAQIVDVFARRGVKFSEASFRKYVQLGLLPRSRRVGSKGKHKGSRGVYPVGTVRQINEIKRLMAGDLTIDEIREQYAFVGGDIEELRRLLEGVLAQLEKSVAGDRLSDFGAADVRRRIEEARRASEEALARLEDAARRVREQATVARDAV